MDDFLEKERALARDELTQLEVLREALNTLLFTDFGGKEFAHNISSEPKSQQSHIVTTEENNQIIFEFNEALKDLRIGMPLSLQGKSIQHFQDILNNLRRKLIDAGKISPTETL